eukprot:m.717796 g.717796  ORF g.717796 m.717796 type:complete len:389 (+) comp22988_c0_seq14:125-1291(+)
MSCQWDVVFGASVAGVLSSCIASLAGSWKASETATARYIESALSVSLADVATFMQASGRDRIWVHIQGYVSLPHVEGNSRGAYKKLPAYNKLVCEYENSGRRANVFSCEARKEKWYECEVSDPPKRQRRTTAHEAEQSFETVFSNLDTSSSCSHCSNAHRSTDCRWRHDNGGDCGRRHGQQDVNCRVRWKNTSSEAEHREALPTFELTAPAFLSAASATGDSVSIDGYALRRNMFGPGVLRDFREEFECVSGAAERAKLAQFMTQAYAEGYSSKKPSKNERNVLLGVQHVTSVLQVGTRVHVIGEAQLTPSGILLTSRHDGSTVAPGSNGMYVTVDGKLGLVRTHDSSAWGYGMLRNVAMLCALGGFGRSAWELSKLFEFGSSRAQHQ